MTSPEIFPFGRPVLPCPPSADGPRRSFLLGAYPSAIHIRWTPPGDRRTVRAIPVENEPEPFWTGDDQVDRVQRWRAVAGFSPRWGTAEPAGHLNGSSGEWVKQRILGPLGLARDEVWITDCLPTYRQSVEVGARLQDTYDPFARTEGLPAAALARHPTEAEIVAEALAEQRQRLLMELAAAQPERIITLGRAALRVLQGLVRTSGKARLQVGPDGTAVGGPYGQPVEVEVAGRSAEWLPLAHPAAPPRYQKAHDAWIAAVRPSRPA
jgi:hypothetical protein